VVALVRPAAENNGYLRWCVDTFDVRKNIRFDTEVTALTWDDTSACGPSRYKTPTGNRAR
jgi:hypothetical protein